ncbi:MAG: hypothetical protein ACPGJE_00535, partial [Wenzhouxiangellaceae bacterium]
SRGLVAGLLVALAASAGAQSGAIQPKQLAGPPSEFPQHRLPDARDAALRSTSVLLPVELAPSREGGWQWSGRLTLDGENPRFVVFGEQEGGWRTLLTTAFNPDARAAETLATDSGPGDLGIGNERFYGTVYQFDQRAADWTVTLRADAPGATEGFVLAASDSPWQLVSWHSGNAWPGQPLEFHASSEHRHERDAGQADIARAWLRVTAPDGRISRHAISGNGYASLSSAPRELTGVFVPQVAGDYTVQVMVEGRTPDGQAFQRSAQHLVTVVDNPVEVVDGIAAGSRVVDETRLMIDPGVTSRAAGGFVHAWTEVWGTVGKEMVPVAWIGGMVDAARPELALDGRWIALAGASAPFELRNLRLSDADHFVTLASVKRRALAVGRLPQAASRIPDKIDPAMRMGPRPEWGSSQRAGARLLLVHGYCSGNVWGGVAGQFTGESIFQDFNQNRSHDAFARQILSFGQSYDSYGIVAHSQGGAAATHLYTYYWSGLDFASGGRLIQSVGTPYHGTALAGNLAAIGDVFGVGCGTNSNLTYSGSASWLAGIPSWARAAVNYYTTSFTDLWWRWDYCNAV